MDNSSRKSIQNPPKCGVTSSGCRELYQYYSRELHHDQQKASQYFKQFKLLLLLVIGVPCLHFKHCILHTGPMNPSRPPFQHNLPPVQLNINNSQTQENTLNCPPEFIFTPTPIQQAQAAQAVQAAYASFFREQMQTRSHTLAQHPISGTPPHSTQYQPHFPTSQIEPNLGEASNVPPKVSNRKAPNWKHNEDVALCEAWVQRSENPIVGTGQTGDSLWIHIFEDFCKKQPGGGRTRIRALYSCSWFICLKSSAEHHISS